MTMLKNKHAQTGCNNLHILILDTGKNTEFPL